MKKTAPDSAPTGTEAATEPPMAPMDSARASERSNRKGKSGNPRRRQRALRNFRTVVESELNQKIPLRQGTKVSATTKQRAFVVNLVDGALKRDPKAISGLIALLSVLGILGEPPEPTSIEPVTAHDGEIIADFLRRQGISTEHQYAIDLRQSTHPKKGAKS